MATRKRIEIRLWKFRNKIYQIALVVTIRMATHHQQSKLMMERHTDRIKYLKEPAHNPKKAKTILYFNRLYTYSPCSIYIYKYYNII